MSSVACYPYRMSDDTIKLQEAMKKLDISRPTILRWIEDGVFPGAVNHGGPVGWKIPVREVEAKRDDIVAGLQAEIEHLLSL
jgi:predicted DNA-binding transcriptional regulator AlpA